MTDPLTALTALICEHSGLTGVRAERLARRIAAEWLPAQGDAADDVWTAGFEAGRAQAQQDAAEERLAMLRQAKQAAKELAGADELWKPGATSVEVILGCMIDRETAARAAVDEGVAEHD